MKAQRVLTWLALYIEAVKDSNLPEMIRDTIYRDARSHVLLIATEIPVDHPDARKCEEIAKEINATAAL